MDKLKSNSMFCMSFLILLLGLYLRLTQKNDLVFDNDEIYQFANIQLRNGLDVFNRNSNYGDHTSFPGEFILHYLSFKICGIFENNIVADARMLILNCLSTTQRCIIFLPKVLTSVGAIIVFFYLCLRNIRSHIGLFISCLIFSLHPQLINHSVEFRPYGALVTLAILNLFLSDKFTKDDLKHKWIYYVLFFFTSIYHAYGILISCLPLSFFLIIRNQYQRINLPMKTIIILSALAWGYYASYNSFGMMPNDVQAKVDPFEFMPIKTLGENVVVSLFGNWLFYVAILPLLVFSEIKYCKDIFFLVLLILVPIALIIAIDIKTSYWIHMRQWVWVIPFFCIFTGKQFDYIIEENQ